jgi:sugar transferase (PEP-CTERM/EpsH1 system associated)
VRILFLSERFPYPLHDGGNLRSFHVLKGLASRHDVRLVAHRRPGIDADAIRTLESFCRVTIVDPPSRWRSLAASLANGGAFSQPLFLAKNWSGPLSAAADRALARESLDAIHFNHLDTACYSLARNWSQRKVFDTHNCLSAMAADLAGNSRWPWKRALYGREARRLQTWERQVCQRMDAVLTCSDEEAAAFGELAGGGDRFVVAPNGVDCRWLAPRAGAIEEPGALVFTGAMGYFPNQDAALHLCHDILPLLGDLRPAPRLYLVGKDPPAAVRALHNGTSVIVTGQVEDVRPYLERAALVVVPLRHGAGTRLKILEAFAMGKAVVSTCKGAEGIEAADGQEILLAANAEQFAAQIRRAWSDAVLRRCLGAAAIKLASQRYDWPRIQEIVLGAYDRFEQANVAVVA